MNKQKAIIMAQKDIKNALYAIRWSENRSGITKEERENLQQKLEYANLVLQLVEQLPEDNDR